MSFLHLVWSSMSWVPPPGLSQLHLNAGSQHRAPVPTGESRGSHRSWSGKLKPLLNPEHGVYFVLFWVFLKFILFTLGLGFFCHFT